MSLVKKITFILVLTFILLTSAMYILSKYIVLDSFLKINLDNADTNMQRAERAFNDEVQTIVHSAADWAPWDETYNYALGENEDFISENINTKTLENLNIKYMVFTDKDNKLIHYEVSDDSHDSKFNDDLVNYVVSDNMFFLHKGLDTDISGLIKYSDITLIVSSHPIVTNDYQGPIAGTLLFIKIVDEDFINGISERIKLPIYQHNENLPQGYVQNENRYIYEDKIIGLLTLKDIRNNDALILSIEIPKKIYQQGYQSTLFFLAAIIAVGLLTTMLLILFLRFTVIKPIKKLTDASVEMSKGNLGVRVKTNSKDELGKLGESFNSMAEKLQKLIDEIQKSKTSELQKTKEIIKLKDEFVYIAAHELKAPVTAISGFIEILKDYSADSAPQIKENLDILSTATDRLENLLFDLLEISRAESGILQVKLIAININNLIKQITDQYSLKIKENNLTLKINLDETNNTVMADEVKLTEVLNNLISNAIKYNRQNGYLEITSSKKDDFLLTKVKDNGYGIPADMQKKVFSKFFRAVTKSTQDVEGTGLGLFITKMLVEKMGGQIGFTSVENEGSTFHFTLKLNA